MASSSHRTKPLSDVSLKQTPNIAVVMKDSAAIRVRSQHTLKSFGQNPLFILNVSEKNHVLLLFCIPGKTFYIVSFEMYSFYGIEYVL